MSADTNDTDTDLEWDTGDIDPPRVIRRPDKGLTISGTRLTLYALMDYLNDERYSREDICDWLNISDAQLQAGLDYIEAHRDAVLAEYEEVVRYWEERRRYWEGRLRQHLASQPRTPPSPEKAALYAKLAEQRARTIRELAWGDGGIDMPEGDRPKVAHP